MGGKQSTASQGSSPRMGQVPGGTAVIGPDGLEANGSRSDQLPSSISTDHTLNLFSSSSHHTHSTVPSTSDSAATATGPHTSRSNSARHHRNHHHHHQSNGSGSGSGSSSSRSERIWRQRTGSLGILDPMDGSAGRQSSGLLGSIGTQQSPDSPDPLGSDDLFPLWSRLPPAHSLPVQLVPFNGIKCPVCSKFVLPDDVECHLVMCLTKPRLSYNEDVLTEAKDECVICLEEMNVGDTIARLPCLCIYHKTCIDRWFQVNRSCPEHPSD